MNKSSQAYERRFTKTFDNQFHKLRDSIRTKRIKQRVDQIVASPYANIDFGAGQYRGKRKDRAGDDRIVFTVCEQCRNEHHEKYNDCSDCNTTPNNMVTFWEIIEGHKYRTRN